MPEKFVITRVERFLASYTFTCLSSTASSFQSGDHRGRIPEATCSAFTGG